MSLKNRNASLLTAALSSVLVLAVSLSAQDRSHESQPSVATLPPPNTSHRRSKVRIQYAFCPGAYPGHHGTRCFVGPAHLELSSQ